MNWLIVICYERNLVVLRDRDLGPSTTSRSSRCLERILKPVWQSQ